MLKLEYQPDSNIEDWILNLFFYWKDILKTITWVSQASVSLVCLEPVKLDSVIMILCSVSLMKHGHALEFS